MNTQYTSLCHYSHYGYTTFNVLVPQPSIHHHLGTRENLWGRGKRFRIRQRKHRRGLIVFFIIFFNRNFMMRCLKHVFRFGGGLVGGGLVVEVAVVGGLKVVLSVVGGLKVVLSVVGGLNVVLAGVGGLNVVPWSNGGKVKGGKVVMGVKPVSSCSFLARSSCLVSSCLVSSLSSRCLSELRSTW